MNVYVLLAGYSDGSDRDLKDKVIAVFADKDEAERTRALIEVCGPTKNVAVVESYVIGGEP